MSATTTTITTTTTTTTTGATTSNGAGTNGAGTNGATAGSTLELVERARASLLEACHSRAVTDRYLQSRLAALRAAAALVSARAAVPVDPGPRNLWDLLPTVAPELTEWAAFFDAAGRRLDAGPTAREADDLLRQAETFVDLVCRALGLPLAPPHDAVLVPTAWA